MAAPSLEPPPLFLACTRPAMVAGAPMEAVGLNLIVCACAVLMSRSPAWLLVAPVLHLVFRAIARTDAYAFRILALHLAAQARSAPAPRLGGRTFGCDLGRRRYDLSEVRRG